VGRGGSDVRVLLIDDNELFRTGVARVLAEEEDLHVVGDRQADDSAISLAQRERPDIVLMDVDTRGVQPEQYLARLRQASPASKVIVLTMREDPELIRRLLASGLRAYLLKSATRDELLASLRAMARGSERTILSVSPGTLRGLELQVAANGPPGRHAGGLLSTRELQVLTRLAHGQRNAQIATELGIAVGTVKRHLTNIYTKLGAGSRMDAVNRAISRDLISPAGLKDGRPQSPPRSAGEQR
jgi:DNA-binding NarL/FixJ family response regulator